MIHIEIAARTTRGAAQSIDAGRRVGAGVVAGGSTAALRRRGLPSSVSVMVPSWVWSRSDGVEGLPFWRRAAGTDAFWPYRNLLLRVWRCEGPELGKRCAARLLVSYKR